MTLSRLYASIVRALVGDPGEPDVLDFVPVTGTHDWREEKLKAAAEKHARPFKCGPNGLPRERMKGYGQRDGYEVI